MRSVDSGQETRFSAIADPTRDRSVPDDLAKGKESENSCVVETCYYDYGERYRWILICTFTIMAVFIGAPFMGWPAMEQMFSLSNAYADLCHKSDPSFAELSYGEINCDAKKSAIAKLRSLAGSNMYIFSFVAGVLLDTLGGKVCSAFGLICQILGWIFVSLKLWTPGIFFISAGVDPAFFGLLSVSNLFPGHNATVLSVLGAARSVSFGIPIVMQAIWNMAKDSISLRGLSLGFGGILVLWLAFTCWFVPFQSFPKLAMGQSLDRVPGEGKVPYRARVRRRPRLSWSGFLTGAKKEFLNFLKYAKDIRYLALLPVPIVTIINEVYYATTYESQLPDAVQFYSLMAPLSGLPCPLLGVLADRVSSAFVIGVLAFCGGMATLTLTFKSIALQYISVVFIWIFWSFISSQFYCYVAAVYPEKDMGRLVGFVLLVGGSASVGFPSLMREYARQYNRFAAMNIVLLVLELGIVAIAAYLYFAVERPVRNQKATQPREAVKNEV